MITTVGHMFASSLQNQPVDAKPFKKMKFSFKFTFGSEYDHSVLTFYLSLFQSIRIDVISRL